MRLAEIANPFPFEVLDTYNGKDLLKIFAKKNSKDSDQIIKDFIATAKSESRVELIFSELLKPLV
jgi:hypothetical protein